MNEPTKTCTTCKRTLPVSRFSKDRRKRDGLYSRCKDCQAAAQRASRERAREAEARYRQTHVAELRERKAVYYQEHKAERNEAQRRYRHRQAS